ncbi:MAG: hypothetical protein HY901_03805 [Deltaproteobacteria bacterium]|nr:hypothetical protein [Deltaproteobacteria bacterium]
MDLSVSIDRAALLILVWLLHAAPAHASLFVAQSFEELARGADLIVRGTVRSQEAAQLSGRLVQLSTVEIAYVLKGAPATAVEVLTLGGAVGPWRQRVPGAPTLAPGETVLLFLRQQGRGPATLHGFAQGKFNVAHDEAGRSAVIQRVSGARGFTAEGAALPPWTFGPVLEPEFAQRVREALGDTALQKTSLLPEGLVSWLGMPLDPRPFLRSVGKDPNVCLYWTNRRVPFWLNPGGAESIGPALEEAVIRSLETWGNTGCSDLKLDYAGLTEDAALGASPTGTRRNVIMLRTKTCSELGAPGGCLTKVEALDEDGQAQTALEVKTDSSCVNEYLCWASGPSTVGLTTVFFDAYGRIVEADVELNATGAYRFRVVEQRECLPGQPCNIMDVQSVVTHELGHALGLADQGDPRVPPRPSLGTATSALEDRTMYFSINNELGEDLEKRTLDADDLQGACAIYPAGEPAAACIDVPVVVWGSSCSSTSGPILSGALLSLGVALGFRRRRR